MGSHKKRQENPDQKEFWGWQKDPNCAGLYGQGTGKPTGQEKFWIEREKKLNKQNARKRQKKLTVEDKPGKSVNLKGRFHRPLDKCRTVPVFPLAFIHWEGEDRSPDQK